MTETNIPGNPAEYDEIAEKLFAPVYPLVVQAILERTGKRTGSVLDAGCGGGHLGIAVLQGGDFSDLMLFDAKEDALAMARARVCRETDGTDAQPRTVATFCSDICADDLVERVSEAARSAFGEWVGFDLIISRGSMPFWEDQLKAFENLYGLLAPGGIGYVGGGMGSTEVRKSIASKMAEIRKKNEGEGPHLFDMSQSKALASEEYVALFDRLGAKCTVIANEDEGRWFMFEKPSE